MGLTHSHHAVFCEGCETEFLRWCSSSSVLFCTSRGYVRLQRSCGSFSGVFCTSRGYVRSLNGVALLECSSARVVAK
jgi:hypothetical protein